MALYTSYKSGERYDVENKKKQIDEFYKIFDKLNEQIRERALLNYFDINVDHRHYEFHLGSHDGTE